MHMLRNYVCLLSYTHVFKCFKPPQVQVIWKGLIEINPVRINRTLAYFNDLNKKCVGMVVQMIVLNVCTLMDEWIVNVNCME